MHHGLEVGLPSQQILSRQLCAEEYHHSIIKCDKNTQQATKTKKQYNYTINKCFMKQTRHIHIYLHIQFEFCTINNCIKRHLYISYIAISTDALEAAQCREVLPPFYAIMKCDENI